MAYDNLGLCFLVILMMTRFCVVRAPENLALNKYAWLSQKRYNIDNSLMAASYAVDGSYASTWQVCAQTEWESYPTWMVDLGNIYHIGYIRVTNRDGGADRLADFVVAFKLTQSSEQKGPFPDAEVCHRHSGYPGASQTITVTCHAGATTMARYVYFYLVGERRLLSLCEVEVFHYEDGMTNVYLDGEACPESALSPVANSQQGITTLLHDSDPSTCLSPYSQTMTSFRVLVPAKGSGIVRMVGQRISCSPVSGITILAVTGCVEGTCRHHHCYASLDYIGDGYVMCRYRCVNDTPKLEYALVDLSRITANPAGSICEVYA